MTEETKDKEVESIRASLSRSIQTAAKRIEDAPFEVTSVGDLDKLASAYAKLVNANLVNAKLKDDGAAGLTWADLTKLID